MYFEIIIVVCAVIVVCKFCFRRIVQMAIVVSAVVGSSYAIRTARCWNESEINPWILGGCDDVVGLSDYCNISSIERSSVQNVIPDPFCIESGVALCVVGKRNG